MGIARDHDGVLVDLLMATMNSLEIWTSAAGDEHRGLAWRDAVTARMVASSRYVPYEELVAEAATEVGLATTARADLLERWARMEPWPDAAALGDLRVPFGFVTNCSRELADLAVARSALQPRFTLSADEIGWYKPQPAAYAEGCRRLGTVPDRTSFIAGAPYDAEGALAAGLEAFFVVRRDGHRPPSAGVKVAPSLVEIVAAVNHPGEQAGT
jgi:2-haloacid dehalogenase